MIVTFAYNISEIRSYINWLYFFHAWGFAAKYSAISGIPLNETDQKAWINDFGDDTSYKSAEAAVALYNDAQTILNECENKFLTHAICGIFEANSCNDDIVIYEENGEETIFPCLRQQQASHGDSCLCLADFLRPKEQSRRDRIGVFAATAGKETEEQYSEDPYKHMLYQTLCDRLAEATTELVHLHVRRKYWGYAKDENLSIQQLLSEKFQGIRPAVGYPSLPDQSVIFIIEKLIHFSEIGISTTESGAMRPHSSTCGLMFAHPKAKYFNIGKIGNDQLQDYAKRRSLPLETVEKFLRSNLQ